jgi:hypothetical protein
MRIGENCISLGGTPGKDKNSERKPDLEHEDEPVQKGLLDKGSLYKISDDFGQQLGRLRARRLHT